MNWGFSGSLSMKTASGIIVPFNFSHSKPLFVAPDPDLLLDWNFQIKGGRWLENSVLEEHCASNDGMMDRVIPVL